jgi:hypothetical protein
MTAINRTDVDVSSGQTVTNKTIASSTLTSPKIDQVNDTNGAAALVVTPTTSAVNYVKITNAATGGNNNVTVSADGSDTNVNLRITSKGAGAVAIAADNGRNVSVFFPNTVAANYTTFTPSVSGSSPSVGAFGTDTNVSLNLTTKGSGTIQANGVEVATTSGLQTITNKNLSSGTNTFPTLNQNTTGSAATLTTSRNLQTNLASTSAAGFNGSADTSPGVTGTLAVGNGGTGATTLTGLIKGNGSSAFTAAVAGTDFVTPGGANTLSNKTLDNTSTLSNTKTGVLYDATQNRPVVAIASAVSSVNYLGLCASATGVAPYLTATGTDTDVSLNLRSQGAGLVQANGVPVVTTTGTQTLTNKALTSPTITTPTGITKSDVGLSNVTNVAQEAVANKNVANGYAGLDATGLIPAGLLPSYVDDVLEYTNLAAFPATAETGKIYVATGTGKIYRWSGSTYIEIAPSPGSTDSVTEGATNLYFTAARASAAAPVQSVAGKTGAVSLVKSDVGLNSVDNTADLTKSVLSASKLTSPVTINGVSFDGAKAITVADSTKEPAITAGTTSQYFRGDKTFQTLSTDSVTEGATNLYFTNARASAAAAVQSVAGKTGAVSLVKADVGLGNVDNTSNATERAATASLTNKDLTSATNTFPTLNQNTTGTAANVTGTVALANGGTGQTTAAAAITALTGTQTAGRYLRSDGTNSALAAIVAADVPTLNQNTTGTAAGLSATLAVGSGGTGATTLTGLVKGTGTTAMVAATVGTDYIAPDANTNITANGHISTRTSTVTSGGITTLTVSSSQVQVFTGTSAHTIKLPTTGVIAGQSYTAINNSTQVVSGISSSGAGLNFPGIAPNGGFTTFTARIDTPTAAGDWIVTAANAATGGATYSLAQRDAYAWLYSYGFRRGTTSNVTSGGTLTLTIAYSEIQTFIGTTTHTCVLPTTSVAAGQQWTLVNTSTGAITVNASGGATVATLASNTAGAFIATQATPTTAAHWIRLS